MADGLVGESVDDRGAGAEGAVAGEGVDLLGGGGVDDGHCDVPGFVVDFVDAGGGFLHFCCVGIAS